MSQWNIIVQRGLHDAVAGIYQHFPISARGALSVWLEEHLASSELNPDVYHDHWFSGFLIQMLEELGRIINTIRDTEHHWLTYKRVLQESQELIRQRYQNDPKALFRTLKYYMEQERSLLNPPLPENLGATGIMMSLKTRISSTSALAGNWSKQEVVLEEMKILLDHMAKKRQRTTDIDEEINMVSNGMAPNQQLLYERARTLHELGLKNNEFNKAMMELGQLQKDILMQLGSLNDDVTKELDQWILEQRRAANGFPIERNLDEIESLYVYIVQELIQLFQDTVKAANLQQSAVQYSYTESPIEVLENQQYIKDHVPEMIKAVVKKTFIVEVQPHQVIRSKAAPTKQRQSTVTNSCIKLRLLVGSALNPSLNAPVMVDLISEKEAKKHYDNPMAPVQSKVKLINNQSDLSCNKNTQKCIAEFRGVALANKIERRTKKSQKVTDTQEQEFVAAEKWCFLFRSKFRVFEESIDIETSSIPVCITCHPSQDYNSWGSLLWDNEFAEPNRAPFEVPSVVDCNRLLKVISQKFEVQTGRGLTSDNLRFLAHKLTGNCPPITGEVSWEMFNKKPVAITKKKNADKPVTFWEYIYEILKLCEQTTDPKKADEANQHFQKYWAEGKVEGFIFREEMEQKLRDSADGTFMLRFSDNCPGSVTVNFNYKLQWDIQKFEPYSLDDLSNPKALPLWHRILKKPCLTYLYPNIPKETAFPEPQTQKVDSSKSHLYRMGYIRTFMEEKFDTSGLRSRNVSTSSTSTNTSYFNSSGPSSSVSASLTPHSVTSPHSPPGGFQDSSNTSNPHDYQSSSMDETMEIFKAIREAGMDFDDLPYDLI